MFGKSNSWGIKSESTLNIFHRSTNGIRSCVWPDPEVIRCLIVEDTDCKVLYGVTLASPFEPDSMQTLTSELRKGEQTANKFMSVAAEKRRIVMGKSSLIKGGTFIACGARVSGRLWILIAAHGAKDLSVKPGCEEQLREFGHLTAEALYSVSVLEFGNEILGERTLDAAIKRAIDAAALFLPIKHALVSRYDEARNCLVSIRSYGFQNYDFAPGVEFHPGQSISAKLIRDTETIFIRNYALEYRNFPSRFKAKLDGDNLYSFLGVRLTHEKRTIGAFLIADTTPEFFVESDAQVLNSIGTYIAAAIARVGRHSKDRLREVQKLGRSGPADLDDPAATESMGWLIKDLMSVDSCQVFLMSEVDGRRLLKCYFNEGWDQEKLEKVGEHYYASGGILEHVARTGETVYIPDTRDTYGDGQPPYKEYDPKSRSELAVPIRDGTGRPAGVLNLEHFQRNYFSESEIALVETIAGNNRGPLVNREFLQAFSQELQEIASIQDYGGIVQQIAKSTQRALQADNVLIFLMDPYQDRIEKKPAYFGDLESESDHFLVVSDENNIPREVIKGGDDIFADVTADDAILSGSTTERDTTEVERFYRRERIRSSAALLLRTPGPAGDNEETLGVMFVNYREHTAMQPLRPAMKALASLASRSISRARDIQGQRRKIIRIRDLGRELNRCGSTDEIWQRVAGEILAAVKSETASVFVFDKSIGRLTRRKMCGYDGRDYDTLIGEERYVPGKHFTGSACRLDYVHDQNNDLEDKQNAPVLTSDAEHDRRVNREYLAKYRRVLNSGVVRQMVAVPLCGDFRPFGVLRVVNKIEKEDAVDPQIAREPFSSEDIELIAEMAQTAAVAYSKYLKGEKHRILSHLSSLAIKQLDVDKLCKYTAEQLTGDVFGYKACFVRLMNERKALQLTAFSIRDEDQLTHAIAYLKAVYPRIESIPTVKGSGRTQQSISSLLAGEEKFEFIEDVRSEESNYRFPRLAQEYALRSLLDIPLVLNDEVQGTIAVYTGDAADRTWMEQDEKVICRIHDNEKALLLGFADELALAKYYAEIHGKWRNFFTISRSVLRESDLGKAVHILMKKGVTAPDGLDFDRAIMFHFDVTTSDVEVLKVLEAQGELEPERFRRQGRRRRQGEEGAGFDDGPHSLSDLLSNRSLVWSSHDPVFKEALRDVYIYESQSRDISSSILYPILKEIWPDTPGDFAVVPMRLEGSYGIGWNGYIYVDNRFSAKAIRPRLDILNTFADFAASVLQRHDFNSYKERVIVDISHQLKTPLVTVTQCLGDVWRQMQKESSPGEPIRLRRIDWINTETALEDAKLGRNIVDTIVALHDHESTRKKIVVSKKNVPVHTVLRTIATQFKEDYKKRICWHCELDLRLRTDRKWFDMALFQVVHNALKYSKQEPVIIRGVGRDDKIAIEVVDRGPGIHENHRELIFRRFWKAPGIKAAPGELGIGLGLYLVAYYIRRILRDSIELDSQVGKGSTFRFLVSRGD